jgi:hypothetical protein
MPAREKLLRYAISLAIVFFIGQAIDLACGPEPDPYDYSVSFFRNDIAGGNDYRAFYFTASQILYTADESVSEEDVNSREWARYLGGNVKVGDVKLAMYHLSYKTDSTLLQGYLNLQKPLPDSLKHNTFLHAVRRNRPALLYYRLAKIVEPGVTGMYYWHPSLDTNYLYKTAGYALNEAKHAKSRFLRIRYYYQVQRLYHYTGHVKDAADIYDKYIAGKSKDYYINGLALALRAGEERWIGSEVKAAYMFSKVFTDFPERRSFAYRDFKFIKVPDSKVIALARNTNEKAVIYAMKGFYQSRLSLNYLEKVYDTEPRSPFVEVLLAREVNKLEGAYLNPKLLKRLLYNNVNGDYYGWNDYLKKRKNINGYINELEQFCTQLSNERKCKNPALGLIAKAYLQWMTGDNTSGFATLAEAQKDSLNSWLFDQTQMIRLLLLTQKIKRLDSVSEKELVPSLVWLDKKVRHELKTHGDSLTPDDYWGRGKHQVQKWAWAARDVYQKVLTPMYLRQHDTTKAALAMQKGMPYLKHDTLRCYHGDYYEDFTTVDFWQNLSHSYDLRKIVAYKQHGGGCLYMNLLTSGLKNTSADALYDLLGTAYLREHNYKKAVEALVRIKKHSEKDFPLEGYEGSRLKSNPFKEQLNDYPKDYNPGKGDVYTKLRFAQKMYHLQVKAKHDPANASKYYFEMATALYNTSYQGNAWFMIAYIWSDGWMEEQSHTKPYFDADLNGSVNAEKLYLKARQLSGDPEFKAKCTFMAAKCKQNRYRGVNDEFEQYKMFANHDSLFHAEIRHNAYFAELRKNYSHTAFYRTAQHECSFLRDFLASTDTKGSASKGK